MASPSKAATFATPPTSNALVPVRGRQLQPPSSPPPHRHLHGNRDHVAPILPSEHSVQVSLPVNIVMNKPAPGAYHFNLPMRCHLMLAEDQSHGLQAAPGRTRLSIGEPRDSTETEDIGGYRSVIYIDNTVGGKEEGKKGVSIASLDGTVA